MASSPYYDQPRLVMTPAGSRASGIMLVFSAIAAITVLGLWIVELVQLWPRHGFIAWLIYAILVTVVYAIIGAVITGIGFLGKFGIIGAVAVVLVCGWVVSW